MEEGYSLSGKERQTDEFMKPLIVEDAGTIRGDENTELVLLVSPVICVRILLGYVACVWVWPRGPAL